MKILSLLILQVFALVLNSCTPCPVPTAAIPPVPSKAEPQAIYRERTKIVVDAGHGGKDPGTRSTLSNKIVEKQLALTTVQQLSNYLQRYGYIPLLTRHRDIFIPLDLRVEFANANQPDLFVSVHYNSAPKKTVEGIEVYYYRSEKDPTRTAESKELAEKVLKRLIAATGAKSRGVRYGDFAVIRETEMPAILVEAGFLSNEQEAGRIQEASYRNQIALGIAQGVRDYLMDSATSL